MIKSAMALLACAVAVFQAGAPAAQEAAPRGDRVTRTTEGFRHASGGETQARPLKSARVPAANVRTKPKDALAQTRSASLGDHWVYDAFVEVEGDLDGDGFYHFLRTVFDVDTLYEAAYVFAEIYLSADGEHWEHLYTTEDFLVEGQTAFDEYEVETELVDGYPPAYYDVLIEIYDADYVEYVDEFGPAQSPAMALIALEDMYEDGVPSPPPVIVVEEDGGGGAAAWLLLLLAGVALRRLMLFR